MWKRACTCSFGLQSVQVGVMSGNFKEANRDLMLGKTSLTIRALQKGNGLPLWVRGSASLEVFKQRLGKYSLDILC